MSLLVVYRIKDESLIQEAKDIIDQHLKGLFTFPKSQCKRYWVLKLKYRFRLVIKGGKYHLMNHETYNKFKGWR